MNWNLTINATEKKASFEFIGEGKKGVANSFSFNRFFIEKDAKGIATSVLFLFDDLPIFAIYEASEYKINITYNETMERITPEGEKQGQLF